LRIDNRIVFFSFNKAVLKSTYCTVGTGSPGHRSTILTGLDQTAWYWVGLLTWTGFQVLIRAFIAYITYCSILFAVQHLLPWWQRVTEDFIFISSL